MEMSWEDLYVETRLAASPPRRVLPLQPETWQATSLRRICRLPQPIVAVRRRFLGFFAGGHRFGYPAFGNSWKGCWSFPSKVRGQFRSQQPESCGDGCDPRYAAEREGPKIGAVAAVERDCAHDFIT